MAVRVPAAPLVLVVPVVRVRLAAAPVVLAAPAAVRVPVVLVARVPAVPGRAR
jgi:hypothetical protein